MPRCCIFVTNLHPRQQPFRDAVTDLEIQVLNATGGVNAEYRLADLEVLDNYTIPISTTATGACVSAAHCATRMHREQV